MNASPPVSKGALAAPVCAWPLVLRCVVCPGSGIMGASFVLRMESTMSKPAPSLADVQSLAARCIEMADPQLDADFEAKFGQAPAVFAALPTLAQQAKLQNENGQARPDGVDFTGGYSPNDLPADLAFSEIILVQDAAGEIPARIVCIDSRCKGEKSHGYYLNAGVIEPDDKAVAALMRGDNVKWKVVNSNTISPIDLLNPKDRFQGAENQFLHRNPRESMISEVCRKGVNISHVRCLSVVKEAVLEKILHEAREKEMRKLICARKAIDRLDEIQVGLPLLEVKSTKSNETKNDGQNNCFHSPGM